MYLPGNLTLCKPHVTTWTGDSGRRYDFAVARVGTGWVDEPAVYILTRRDGATIKALYVGHTGSLQKRFGSSTMRCPEEWRHALAMGMTHVHLRFEACSERVRQAEARDLLAALQPVINQAMEACDAGDAALPAVSTAPRTEPAAVDATASGRSTVTQLARSGGGLAPAISLVHSAAGSGRLFRADPCREEAGDTFSPVLVGSPADIFARGTSAGGSRIDAASEHREPRELAAERPTPAPLASLAEDAPTAEQVAPSATEAELQAPAPAFADTPLAVALQVVADLHQEANEPERAAAATRRPGLFARLAALFRRVRTGAEEKQPAAAIATPWATSEEIAPAGPTQMVVEPVRAEPVIVPPRADVDPLPEREAEIIQLSRIAAAEGAETCETVEQRSPEPAPRDTEPTVAETEAVAEVPPSRPTLEQEKQGLGLDPNAPVVLCAGSLSYGDGADILMDALPTVCGSHPQTQFIFAGEGPMRGELEARASHAGLGHRCRFLGHVPETVFGHVLAACDFVVIPAREPQGEALARSALEHEKPVLTTHAAALSIIAHGSNGLVAYDNPNSLVWGLRELLGPLCGELRRHLAKAA